MPRGGWRPGAGRKKRPPEQVLLEKLAKEQLFRGELARRARALWRAARRIERRGGDPAGPEPSRQDAAAAANILVSVGLRCAFKGDGNAVRFLYEAAFGPVPRPVTLGGDPDGVPIPLAPAAVDVTYRCVIPRRAPRGSE